MEQFTYKKIDVENYDAILAELKSFCEPLIDPDVSFKHLDITHFIDKCPLTMIWFKNHNLELRVVAIVSYKENATELAPHIDTQRFTLALNFPIQNCESSYTAFYKLTKGDTRTRVMANGTTYIEFVDAEFNELDRVTLDCATVINTKLPHQVWNTSTKVRTAISFRFTRDPWELVE
jgi:hypothetical protein